LGLVRSYSRGAWLATLGGAAYLCRAYAQKSQGCLNARRSGAFIIFSNIWNLRWSLLIASFAVGTLLLPHFSRSDHVLAKRIASALNLNDFSSQNRLIATEGALQIIANNPALGVGWPGAATQFAEFYAPAALSDPWSIILNDYLTLGMSLGLPRFGCLYRVDLDLVESNRRPWEFSRRLFCFVDQDGLPQAQSLRC